MKRLCNVCIFFTILFVSMMSMSAQKIEPLKLNKPDMSRGSSVMKAFADRHSERDFSEKKLSLQDLSDLLWAANGINRPETGMRTAASALNKQDIDIYVIMEEGAYLYDAKEHELKPVAEGDYRPLIAVQQEFAAKAPVSLLMVSDLSRFGNMDEAGKKNCAALDAGIVSQNISLFCSGCGLATVPRGSMNTKELTEVLNLSPSQLPVINNPVGYPVTEESKDVVTFDVGKFKLSTLSEKMGAGNTQTLIGVTPELIQKYLPDGFRTEVNAFLVKTPEKTILIDAGLGQGLSKNLKTLNVQAGQIDIILLTHMHGDHIGGLLSDEKKVFPNADLFLSKPEYDYWIKSDNKRAKTVLEAYKDRLKLFQPVEPGSKKQNLFPGIQGIAAYGHTPGHTAYLLESGSSKLLIWGDLTHVMAIQMPHPEIAMTYDVDAKQAINSRKKLLEFVAKNNIPVAGMHILFPAVGEVKTDGQGYLFTQKK